MLSNYLIGCKHTRSEGARFFVCCLSPFSYS